jgi:hypothetical protein
LYVGISTLVWGRSRIPSDDREQGGERRGLRQSK